MKKARFYRAKLKSPYGVISTYESGNIYELHEAVKKQINAGFTQIRTADKPVIKQYATEPTLKAYQNGKITRAQAIAKATARALKENEKRKRANLDKLTEAENAPVVFNIDVQIEWKSSRTWGANPFCECGGGGYYTTGRASGCGYDKRSAATAQAFNSNPAIMKALYTAEEKRLAKRNKPTRHDFIGYGSGCGILPAFEGGAGISSHGRIFENIGFTFKTTADTRTTDAYTITRKEKKVRG